MGKAHNFCYFLHHSIQRRIVFKTIQIDIYQYPHDIMSYISNTTRWNSIFLMINDLLNLREAVELYIQRILISKTMKKKDKLKLEIHCLFNEEN